MKKCGGLDYNGDFIDTTWTNRMECTKKVQGKADIELNRTGIRQAEETATKLKNINIDIIICSPLKRARQTADIINAEKNLSVIIDDRISERDFGEFEGIPNTDFNFNAFWSYNQNLKYDKAENIKDFFNRVYAFLDDIREKYKGKRILIVSHGGISIPIKCYFNGIPDIGTLLPLCIDNCEIAKFNYTNRDELKR